MRRPPPEALQLDRWPSVDPSALNADSRRRYRQRVKAVELYVRGLPISEIERRAGIDRRTLYRSLERALSAHADGRPWGFRALIPQSRTKAYERGKRAKGTGYGLAGAFTQLLGRHPELERLVRQLIQRRDVWLLQRGDRFVLQELKPAHQRFERECRAIGLTASDYPLNQDEKGLRSLGRVLRQRMLDGFGQATRSAGTARQKPAAALALEPEPPVTEPFDTVEFDAHRLDLRLTILDQDPYGQEIGRAHV